MSHGKLWSQLKKKKNQWFPTIYFPSFIFFQQKEKDLNMIASSGSKEYPFSQQSNSSTFDAILSQIPFFQSSSSKPTTTENPNTFRTLDMYKNDPELFMGDNCDALYEDTLLNSSLLQYLTSDMDGFTKNHKEIDTSLFNAESQTAHHRLEMLLAHVNTIHTTPPHQNKGKGVDRQ